ncbi:MAG: hypothetical protein ACQESG_08115 [Nanobdellota archaeon]
MTYQEIKSAVESTIRAVSLKENFSQQELIEALAGNDSYLASRIYTTLAYCKEDCEVIDEDLKDFLRRYQSLVRHDSTYLSRVLNIENLAEEEVDDLILLYKEQEFMTLGHERKIAYILENLDDCPFLLELYGKELEVAQEYEKAIELYKVVLDTDPDSIIAHIGLGYIYKTMDNQSLARMHLQNALEWLRESGSDTLCLIQEIQQALSELRTYQNQG